MSIILSNLAMLTIERPNDRICDGDGVRIASGGITLGLPLKEFF